MDTVFPQNINPALSNQKWPAAWVRFPDGPHTQSAVYLFRKPVTLSETPERFVVHLTADQRYQLFVNGQRVCWGPARGDLLHWRYETVDIAPFLQVGENVIGVLVHFLDTGIAPLAQLTCEAAFLMQGDTDAEAVVNTPGNAETGFWQVVHDESYSFSLADMKALHSYFSVGPSEYCDLTKHPHGWQLSGFDSHDWVNVERVSRSYSAPYGLEDGESSWWLVPRSIPLMEETEEAFGRLVRVEGVASGELPLTVPPRTKAVLLFDHSFETCAFPEIVVSSDTLTRDANVSEGAGAKVALRYAESLLPADAKPWELNRKGDRNETENRVLYGYADYWTLDSGENRRLRPLWWKTFRYAELTIETADEPVTLTELRAIMTGYPFVEKAVFEAEELPDAAKIWEVGWRTIRRCTHETYVDCPFYEQLQYVGDTRIQALITHYVSGDSRLWKNAISLLFDSRLPDGLTHSRYPSRVPQIITGFSLWWVCMVQDFARHVPGEEAFLRAMIPGIRSVLGWFRDRQDTGTKLLGPLEWWCFGDWATTWRFGTPPGAKEGGSTFLALQYALALEAAADVIANYDPRNDRKKELRRVADEAERLRDEAESVVEAVRKLCFDEKTMRVADTPAHETYSQHAAILSVLIDAVPEKRQAAVMERVLSDTDLTQATFYFRFYLNRALVKAGLGDHYLETLGLWRDMLNRGLTTWAENPEPTRSDCHAWSASPNYEFLATVLGIMPASDGFATVHLRPHLSQLTKASGKMPHPGGEIAVTYRRDGDTLHADVSLPPDVTGKLFWHGDTVKLNGGAQSVRVKSR